ncbi:MAG: MBL fold metallo-hydrolase [Candidatus Aminicenantes bacterium]|nr:MBL fold metallo-hydrolase [Candidatus Aminicenantes bacterium]
MIFLAAALTLAAGNDFETDVFKIASGDLRITFIGHASLLFQYAGKAIYVDPDGRRADFALMPKADLVIVTHQHGDHFDPQAIAALRHESTRLFLTDLCRPLPAGARTLKNGDRAEFAGVAIEAVPAYNLVHLRPDGTPYHPRGQGNGYVLTFPGLRVYLAGDTENIPEMAELQDIDVAFLPMNVPYTMTPEMTAKAARTIRPRVLYPYHFSESDPQRLVELLRDEPAIEVRVRRMR